MGPPSSFGSGLSLIPFFLEESFSLVYISPVFSSSIPGGPPPKRCPSSPLGGEVGVLTHNPNRNRGGKKNVSSPLSPRGFFLIPPQMAAPPGLGGSPQKAQKCSPRPYIFPRIGGELFPPIFPQRGRGEFLSPKSPYIPPPSQYWAHLTGKGEPNRKDIGL